MPKQPLLIRIMGESDIVDVNMIKTGTKVFISSALLVGLDRSDQINLLGHWMDQDRGAALASETSHLDAMTKIAIGVVTDSSITPQLEAGANFVLLTIFREKWPVGSKAKFRLIAIKSANPVTCIATLKDDKDPNNRMTSNLIDF